MKIKSTRTLLQYNNVYKLGKKAKWNVCIFPFKPTFDFRLLEIWVYVSKKKTVSFTSPICSLFGVMMYIIRSEYNKVKHYLFNAYRHIFLSTLSFQLSRYNIIPQMNVLIFSRTMPILAGGREFGMKSRDSLKKIKK